MSKEAPFHITDKTCHNCFKTFSGRSQLYRHLREVHKEFSKSHSFYEKDECIFKCLEGCSVSFRFNRDLRFHLNECHSFNIVERIKQFRNVEAFQKWLQGEQESGAQFIRHRGAIRTDKRVTYYSCNRTGFSRIKVNDRKRQLKKNGTRKINAGCTSFIKLEENGEECRINYCNFHYGHKIELEHLPLPTESRAAIVEKLANGATLLKIDLKREDIEFDSIQRSDLLTRSDLKNLKNFTKSRNTLLVLPHLKHLTNQSLPKASCNLTVNTDENSVDNMLSDCQGTRGSKEETVEDSGSIDDENIEVEYVQEEISEHEDEDEDESFVAYVAKMIKHIDPMDRAIVRDQINEILENYVVREVKLT